jgi:hypothetical protein
MSLFTILSLAGAFVSAAQADHSDDVKHALYVLKSLPKEQVEPYCSKLGTSGGGSTITLTEAQYTITTTLGCSETGGYGTETGSYGSETGGYGSETGGYGSKTGGYGGKPWETKVCPSQPSKIFC